MKKIILGVAAALLVAGTVVYANSGTSTPEAKACCEPTSECCFTGSPCCETSCCESK